MSNARIHKKRLDKERKVRFFVERFVNYDGDFLCRIAIAKEGLIKQSQSVHKRDVELQNGACVRVSFVKMKSEHFAHGFWSGIDEKFIQLEFKSGDCDKSSIAQSLTYDESFANIVYHAQYHDFLSKNGGIKSERHLTKDEY